MLMGFLDEIFVGEDATQAAHRRLNADSIGESVAKHLNGITPTVDTAQIAGAIEGGLGSIAMGLDGLAGGMSDMAESLGRGLGTVNANIESLGSGIDSLHADFNIALGDLIWQSQQQTQALSSIIDTLKAPVGTEAYEYRLRGEDSYKNGWYEEALSDLQKSAELNFRDFSVHRTIGNIFFYHHIPSRFREAREAYEKAAKYSRPRDAKQAAEAHLFAAFACAGLGEWQAVAEHCNESTTLNPSLLEAHYTCAQAMAQLGDLSGCWQRLSVSINGDPRYFVQAEKDSLFIPLRSEIDRELNAEKSRAIAAMDSYLGKVAELASITSILTTSEAKQLRDLADVLSSAHRSDSYPIVAHAVALAKNHYKPISDKLSVMAARKAQLRQEASDALSELREGVYEGSQYIIEAVKPGVDAMLEQAYRCFEAHTLDGYTQAISLAGKAWDTAYKLTVNRYAEISGYTTRDFKIVSVLEKKADYDRRQEKKRAQDMYDQQQFWRVEGRCLECGHKIGVVDRLKGHEKCPTHR